MKKTFTRMLMLLGAFLLLGAGNAHADYYLVGASINNWSTVDLKSEYKFTKKSDTVYELTVAKIPAGQFKIYSTDGWDSSYGAKTEQNYNTEKFEYRDTEYYYARNSNTNINATSDFYNVKLTLTLYDYNNNERKYDTACLKMVENKDKYIINSNNNTDWTLTSGTQMNWQSLNEYKATLEVNNENGNAFFCFTDKYSNSNTNWNGLGTRYVPEGAKDVSVDITSNLKDKASSYNIQTGTDGAFRLPNGTYEVTLNLTTNQMTVKLIKLNYPKTIYLYGDVKNSNWDTADPYEAISDENNPGVYTFQNVSIYGNQSKTKNYFSFFYNESEDTKYGEQLPRINALNGNTTGEGNNNHEFAKPEKGKPQTADAAIRSLNQTNPDEEFNFRIDKGYYDIEVNLVDFKVTIKLAEPISFDWHTGDGIKIDEDKFKEDPTRDYTDGIYTVSYNPEGRKIQVGVGGDQSHDAANHAKFTIYHSPTVPEQSAPNIRAISAIPDGYTDVTENSEYVELDEEKNILTLKKVGTYTIEATTEGSEADGVYYDEDGNNPSSSIQMVVAPAPASLESSDLVHAFSNNGESGISVSFHLESNDQVVKNVNTGDLTITIAPQNDAKDWAQNIDDLDPDLYAEYEAISKNTETLSNKLIIDGAYKELEDADKTIKTLSADSNGTITATLPVLPCSGIWVLTVTSDNYTFKENENTLEVTVYPNVMNTYWQTITPKDGKSYSRHNTLNINGITRVQNNDSFLDEISYPKTDGVLFEEYRIGTSSLFIPGLYFADFKFSSENATVGTYGQTEEKQAVKRYADSNTLNSKYQSYVIGENYIDLNALKDGEDVVFYVFASKNGANAPISSNENAEASFTISVGTSFPTGVEAIGAEEEGEAVYYNLQGVRVENPLHGIFVKVQGGKASKVVL